jgi:chromosome segregation ATPase
MSGGISSSLGGESLLAALALLADPVELKRRKDEFLETEQRVLEMTANIGPIQEVAKLRADADAAVKAANEKLDAATSRAAGIEDAAKWRANETLAQAMTEANALLASSNVVKAKAEEMMEFAGKTMKECEAEAEGLRKETEALAQARSEITRQREELANTARALDEKRQRLADASAHISEAIEA